VNFGLDKSSIAIKKIGSCMVIGSEACSKKPSGMSAESIFKSFLEMLLIGIDRKIQVAVTFM
jgi:hypothetical protein